MEKIKFSVITENGMQESFLEIEKTGNTTDQVILDSDFQSHFGNQLDEKSMNFFDANKVCIKTTIMAVEHPFQFKTEFDRIRVCIPLNGCIETNARPRIYRRSVKYIVYAEVCYPVDLILTNVEKCSKQGAIAAIAAAATGNFAAATVTFQAAFLACMAFSDVTSANQISIRVAGDTEHGDWIPV